MQQPSESAPRLASSSSASAAAAAPRRSVGCMAGLLRLLSPYHRHRKRITAKNATAPEASPPAPQPSPPPVKKPATASASTHAPTQPQPQPQQPPGMAVRRRRSCDAPRSPTIAPGYRRASCDSPRPPPPAIVARLMGLEESAPASPAATPRPVLPTRPPPPPPPEMAAEKRRKLLGALEKCDEDLKTLRRIIAAVRAAEMRAAAASDASAPAGEGKGAAKWMDGRDSPSPSPSPSPPAPQPQPKPRDMEQYPSPDSVLDAITSPRFPCRKRSSPCTHLDADSKPGCGNGHLRSKIAKPSRTLVFSGDYCKIKQYCNELHAVAVYHHPAPLVAVEGIPRWKPSAAEAEGWRHRRRWGDLQAAGRSRAMVESVGEVWGQGAGAERWEAAGLVGAALERAILHDLVGDIVAELLAQPGQTVQLAPYGHGHGHDGGGAMCRKRLCF